MQNKAARNILLVSGFMRKPVFFTQGLCAAQFSKTVSKGGPSTYDLTKRKVDKMLKQAPAVKAELSKQIPKFKLLEKTPDANMSRSIVPPDQVLKTLETSFESFFFRRPYTEKNFCFYMQVCAQ